MRTDWVPEDSFMHILAALTPPNRLAILVSLTTGLRIDDVLHIKTEQLRKDRFTVREMKTGKSRRIRLSTSLRDDLLRESGRFYVFEHRLDVRRPRTRQAVFKDLKRACVAFRVTGLNIAPHSARKIYSVGQYKRTCSVEQVQKLLNHSSEAVTMLYAMADELTARHTRNKHINIPK